MPKVKVGLGERSYYVHVERGASKRVAEYLPKGTKVTRALVVSDENVAPLYGGRVAKSFEAAGIRASVAIMPAGEEEKNLRTVERLYHEMVHAGLDRQSIIVAVGGGVVGDVAGFAAATYMRGLSIVQVPTTIVAQVDSSTGGKTGVDLPEGKNLVGAFHQPLVVVTDPETLATLPVREVRAGLAEVVKHGVIRDEKYFAALERLGKRLTKMSARTAEEVILRSVEIKANVVSRDEREGGLRAILNYGHTVGHALEAVTGFTKYLHGEAVAVGMVAAANIAVAHRPRRRGGHETHRAASRVNRPSHGRRGGERGCDYRRPGARQEDDRRQGPVCAAAKDRQGGDLGRGAGRGAQGSAFRRRGLRNG